MLAQANAMLDDLRTDVPDAAGLVVCERQWHAQAYAQLIEDLTGTRPPVVVSDPKSDPGGKLAKKAIDRFRASKDRWIVAVKMISEGVDIPRLAVGVYASKTQTPLFFRQVVGRFVRIRPNEEFNARLLIPAVPDLLRHAREIEEELRHQLDLAAEAEEKERASEGGGAGSQGMLDFRTPVGASEPIFDRAILGGMEATPEEVAEAEKECAQVGIPTRYAVNLVPILRSRRLAATAPAAPSPAAALAETPRHRREKMLRGEITTLVGKYARHAGKEPQEVNADLLRAGHPRRAAASVEELEQTRQTLLEWIGAL
jgi:superfamily II DNA or RNA helicase